MDGTLEIFPLVKFSGAVIRLNNLWWVVGRGDFFNDSAPLRTVAAREIRPDPRLDPRRHWGRVLRSIAQPLDRPLFDTLNRVIGAYKGYELHGRAQVHTLFAFRESGNLPLPRVVAERVLYEPTLVVTALKEGGFSLSKPARGASRACVRYLRPFASKKDLAESNDWGENYHIIQQNEADDILMDCGWGPHHSS